MSNIDQATQAIIQLIAAETSQSKPELLLWVADEHPITTESLTPLVNSSIKFISNRIDQFKIAKLAEFDAEFNDFDFSNHTNDKQHIFFRVAKERALVHHIINQAFISLPLGGTLWLAGYKQEGIKTHIARAAKLFGNSAKVTKSKNQLSVAAITKQAKDDELLDDQQYKSLREFSYKDGSSFWTKPGLYGWDKIDPGSLLLCETLKERSDNLTDKSVLDIGCGYGYLSKFIIEYGPQKLVATDNCAAAIAATSRNLETFRKATVIASDAGDSVSEVFDLILCNPPFHQGFSTNGELHKKFLSNTKELLKPDGQAWYVVNQFLPIEKHCLDASLKCEEITRNKSFKVVLIHH